MYRSFLIIKLQINFIKDIMMHRLLSNYLTNKLTNSLILDLPRDLRLGLAYFWGDNAINRTESL